MLGKADVTRYQMSIPHKSSTHTDVILGSSLVVGGSFFKALFDSVVINSWRVSPMDTNGLSLVLLLDLGAADLHWGRCWCSFVQGVTSRSCRAVSYILRCMKVRQLRIRVGI